MTIKHELQAIISMFFGVYASRITEWRKLSGCNHVRFFCVNGEKYVIRKFGLPHPETAAAEKAAYNALESLGVTDEVLYLDDTGIKITRFIEGAHMGYVTLGAFELAAWQINNLSVEEFQEWLSFSLVNIRSLPPSQSDPCRSSKVPLSVRR